MALHDTGGLGCEALLEVATYDGEWTGAAGDLLAHALEYTARAPSAWASTGSCACRAPTGPTASATKVASCVFNNSVFEEVYARGESLLNSSHRLVRAAVLRERGWRRAKIQKKRALAGLGSASAGGPGPPPAPPGNPAVSAAALLSGCCHQATLMAVPYYCPTRALAY